MYNVLQLLLPGVLYWPMEVWYIVVRWYRTRCYYIGHYAVWHWIFRKYVCYKLWVWLWALVFPSTCPQHGHCWYWYLDKLASVRERMPIQQHKFLAAKVSWMQCIDGNGNDGQYGNQHPWNLFARIEGNVMNRIWVLCNLCVISRHEYE